MYPNSSCEKNKNNIGIRVYLKTHNVDDLSCKSAFQASFSLGIKRDGVRNDFMSNSSKYFPLDKFESGLGFIFMSQTVLFDPDSGYNNDGKLSLHSQVNFFYKYKRSSQ